MVQAELGLSTWAAQKLVADTLSLIYRLPRVFAALGDGAVCEWRARMTASATRELSLDQVAAVDDRLAAGHPQGAPLVARMGRKRLGEVIDQVVGSSEPEEVEDQVAAALADRNIAIRPGERGVADILGTLSDEDAARLEARLEARLAQVVGWLVECGDPRPRSVLRSVGLGMLADPGTLDRLRARVHAHRTRHQPTTDDAAGDARDDSQDDAETDAETDAAGGSGPLPATVLYVHFDRASSTWLLEGNGPLTQAEAEDLVGHTEVTVKPVIDLAQNLSSTGYVAPPALKEQLGLLNAGRCTFPYCDRPAATGDYDPPPALRAGRCPQS